MMILALQVLPSTRITRYITTSILFIMWLGLLFLQQGRAAVQLPDLREWWCTISRGLMAFMCRPSSGFIQIAQKIAVWNGTWASNDGTFATSYETRGKAWGIRSLAHAIFLPPDGNAWKEAGRSALFRNAQLLKTFQDDPKSVLGFIWDFAPDQVGNYVEVHGGTGFTQPLWEHHYLVTEVHKAASAKLLTGTGTIRAGCYRRLDRRAADSIRQ